MSSPRSDDHVDQIQAAIFAGRKIEAIKLYRQSSGKGLKEAKDFVEALEVELRQRSPEQFTAPPAGKGCVGAVVILLLLVGVLPSLALTVSLTAQDKPTTPMVK